MVSDGDQGKSSIAPGYGVLSGISLAGVSQKQLVLPQQMRHEDQSPRLQEFVPSYRRSTHQVKHSFPDIAKREVSTE